MIAQNSRQHRVSSDPVESGKSGPGNEAPGTRAQQF